MLNERYRNALNGFKAQAKGLGRTSFQGCEVEAQHIYRIVMTECVGIRDLDEEKLSGFLAKEEAGLVDYSGYSDREGLQYVDLTKEVEVYPTKSMGCIANPIEGHLYRLSATEAQAMVHQLFQLNQIKLLTETMQSLAQRADGTLLQTAFPSMTELKVSIQSGLSLPKTLMEKLQEWELLGATEVNFDFVEKAQ